MINKLLGGKIGCNLQRSPIPFDFTDFVVSLFVESVCYLGEDQNASVDA